MCGEGVLGGRWRGRNLQAAPAARPTLRLEVPSVQKCLHAGGKCLLELISARQRITLQDNCFGKLIKFCNVCFCNSAFRYEGNSREQILANFFADTGEKRCEISVKHFADFRPLISRRSGRKVGNFTKKISTFSTRAETKLFNREILVVGGPNISFCNPLLVPP